MSDPIWLTYYRPDTSKPLRAIPWSDPHARVDYFRTHLYGRIPAGLLTPAQRRAAEPPQAPVARKRGKR